MKSCSSQIKSAANLTIEEYEDTAVWVAAGQSLDKRTMDLFHHERARHERIQNEFRIELEELDKNLVDVMNTVNHNKKVADKRAR